MPVTESDVEQLLGDPAPKAAGWSESDVEGLLAEPTVKYDVGPEPIELGDVGKLQPQLVHLGPGNTVPAPRPTYDLGQADAERATRLRSIFSNSDLTSVDQEAGLLRLAQETGAARETLRPAYPELQRTWKLSRWDEVKWMRDNPELAKLVLERPELGGIVTKDHQVNALSRAWNWLQDHSSSPSELGSFDPEEVKALEAQGLNEFEVVGQLKKRAADQRDAPKQEQLVVDEQAKRVQDGAWRVFGGGLAVPERLLVPGYRFSEAWQQMRVSRAGYELMLARQRNDLSGANDIEGKLHDLQVGAVRRDYQEGEVGRVVSSMANAAASTAYGLSEGAELATVAGAGAGLATFLATRNPEAAEVVSEGAGAAALRVGSFFGKVGAVKGTFELESGQAYLELLKEKDYQGNPIDEPTARAAAGIYGTLASGIEFASWGPALKAMGPLGDIIKKGEAQAAAKLLLSNNAFRASLRELGKHWLPAAGAEGFEEGLQEATQIAIEHFAKGGQLTGLPGVIEANKQRILESAGEGTIGGFGLGGFEVATGVLSSAYQRDRAISNGKLIEQLAGLKQSPTVRAAPDAVAKMVQDMAARGGENLQAMHVDAEAFVRLFQGENADPDAAATQLLGPDGPKQLQDALAQGKRLEVPLAKYLESWGGTAAAEALAPHTSTSANGLTAGEVEQLDGNVRDLAKRLELEPAESETEASFIAATEAQLEQTQKKGKTSARTQMHLWRAMVRTMADKFGVDPDAMYSGLTVEVEKGKLQDLEVPAASHELAGRLSQGVDRGSEMFLDQVSGLRNRRAFEATPQPKGHQVGVITSPDVKGINDHPTAGGHDVANGLLRAMGAAIGGIKNKEGVLVHPEASRSGTNFLVHVRNEEHFQRVLERVRKSVGQGVTVEGALGENMNTALEAAKQRVDKLRAEGKVRPRGETAVDVPSLKFGPERAASTVPAELGQQLAGLKAEQYFNRAYVTAGGLLTAEARAALPRKKHQLAFDLRGLGKANIAHGTEVGDLMIAEFERVMVELGASDINGTHLSGDEFVAEHDDPKELDAFALELKRALKDVKVEVVASGEFVPVGFRHGIGETYGEADRALNSSRRAEEALRAQGTAVEGRQADLGPRERTAPRPGRNRRQNYPRLTAQLSAAEQLTNTKQLFAGAGEGKGPRGETAINITKEAQRLFKVALNEHADLTTFLHESGHIFLKLFSEAAVQEGAPEQVKTDFAAALTWLGADSFDKLTVEQHEKWAKGFEAYLLEGNAPSARLVGAFESFKLWLIDAYRTMRQLANLPELNQEIRSVFDRLLATDDEIRLQRNGMGMTAPQHQALLMMSPEQQTAYRADLEAATRDTAKRAELAAMKDKLREQETWWKEAKRTQTAMAEEEYDLLPARRAQLTLQGKGELWGDNRTGAISLDRQAVVDAVGDDKRKKFITREKGGVNPDNIADFMGFDTGTQMLQAIVDMPDRTKWVNDQVQQILKDRYGDIIEDRTRLRAAVGKGLHGDMTIKAMMHERAALQRQAGAGAATPINALKATAREEVLKRAIARLDASAALAAERKAATEQAAAAAKGNFSRALLMFEKRLLNMFIWRELLEARDERENFYELAGKLATEKYRKRLGQGHPTYQGGSDLVLEHFGLKDVSPRQVALPSIGQVVDQLELDNQTVGFDEQLLEQLLAKPMSHKALTVAQMRQVNGALKSVKAAARNKATIWVDGKRMAKEEGKARLNGEAEKNLPPRPPPPTSGAETPAQWAGGAWNAIDGEMRKPEFLLNRLGGRDTNSDWHRLIVKQLQDGKALEADLFTQHGGAVIDALQKLGSHKPMQMIDGKALFPNHTKKAAVPQRRFELLVMLLNAGNESNLARLTEGRDITEAELRAAAEKVGVTKDEYDAMQAVWDAFEPLGQLAFDLEERDSGLRPEKIERREFSTPHGKYSGGYFPAVYDFNVTRVGADQAAKLMDPGYVRPGTDKGHLKSRVEGFSDVVSLSPEIITRHVAQAIHDLAYRERLRSVANLLLDEDVAATMRTHLGVGRARIFPQYLSDVGWMRGAEQSRVPQIAGAMRWVRGNLMSVLGYSIPNALEDYATNMTTACVGSGLQFKHLAAALTAVKVYDRKAMEDLEAQSGELRVRRNHIRRDLLKQQANLVEHQVPGRKALRFYKEHAQVLSEMADRTSSATVWLAAQRQYLEEHAENEDERNISDDAVVFADAMVRKILTSHSPVDQSALMRDKGAVGSFLVFFGFFNHAYNREADIIDQAVDANTAKDRAMAIGASLGFMAAVFVIGNIIRGQGPSDGDEPDEQGLPTGQRRALKFRNYAVRKLLVGSGELLPGIGTLGQLGESWYQGKKDASVRNNSIVGIFEGIAKSYLRTLDEGKPTDARVKAFLKTLEPLLGVPVSQELKTGSFLWDWYSGNVDVRGPGDVAGGLIYGQREGQAGNIPTMLQDLAQ